MFIAYISYVSYGVFPRTPLLSVTADIRDNVRPAPSPIILL
jgi:hypothetical protein